MPTILMAPGDISPRARAAGSIRQGDDDYRMIGRLKVRIPGWLAEALREEARQEVAAERPWEYGVPLDALPRLARARAATLATCAAIRAVTRELADTAEQIARCAERARTTQLESWQVAEGEARSRYRELNEALCND